LNARTVPTFSLVPPVGLPLGYKYGARGSVCPPQAICVCPFSPCVPFSGSSPPPSPLSLSLSYVVLDNHGGKEPDPSRGRVGLFLSDKEETRGVGPRWSSVTEGEPKPAGVEGAVVRPPGAGAPEGIHGELRRFP
jgi:hypothetical protein